MKRKNVAKYALFAVFVLLMILAVSWLLGRISDHNFYSIFSAGLITTLNFSFGILSIKIGISKSAKVFIMAFLGGMVIRLFLMLVLVFICLKFLDLSGNNFIFSILFFYVFYLISEILYLNLNNNL